MLFRRPREISRLKKKLLLYFILISIVSISVSAEIILEMSASVFRTSLSSNIVSRVGGDFSAEQKENLQNVLREKSSWTPLFDLRNRMILLLAVISLCVIGAFYLFAKDIVAPMDGLVDAAKKIAAGDFSATAPVMSKDEIGQLASLLNDMNINLQDMIVHIRREIERHKEKIELATEKNEEILTAESDGKILESRRINIATYRQLIEMNNDIKVLLWRMNNDMAALQAYIGSYKTYAIPKEITQHEIESSFKEFFERAGRGAS